MESVARLVNWDKRGAEARVKSSSRDAKSIIDPLVGGRSARSIA